MKYINIHHKINSHELAKFSISRVLLQLFSQKYKIKISIAQKIKTISLCVKYILILIKKIICRAKSFKRGILVIFSLSKFFKNGNGGGMEIILNFINT